MDVTFSNVLEGTRQYFLGLPKQAADGQPEEATPGQSGAPSSSRPPSAAAAPPPVPRAVSPLEPEPHIIHKATVMREAAEKRRERPEPDDDNDDRLQALSPPEHVIRRPQPSPAPDIALAPPPAPRPPENYAPARPPDPYSATRPPESCRYPHETSIADGGRGSHGPPSASPKPSASPRPGPQTYARLSSALPPHSGRLRDVPPAPPVSPAQRYLPPPAPPPNDRVPPLHHPLAAPQRLPPAQYPLVVPHREPSPYGRPPTHYDRHPPLPQRKYDHQHAYPGYRPAQSAAQPQPQPNHRMEHHHPVHYKRPALDPGAAQYSPRPLDRGPAPIQPQPYQTDSRHTHEVIRRADYSSINRSVDARVEYHYSSPSTSSSRYAPAASSAVAPVVQSSTMPSRSVQRPATAPKTSYDYLQTSNIQTSPARSTVKPGYPNQQARMTVSVTTLVNQMNQTKHKRESPLDLSVKTVKNTADSSTTQDDVVDSATATADNKVLVPSMQPRPISSSQHVSIPNVSGMVESHKVDFAPNFTQYRERSHSYGSASQSTHMLRYNGSYESPHIQRVAEPLPVESRQHVYSDRNKYSATVERTEYVPRIDLTRPSNDERRPDNRIRDDRNFIIEERKRPAGAIAGNIPEKIVRYETWSADSRIDRLSQSAREQHELMSQPVYSYSSHKQFEAYQNEQKRTASSSGYREHTQNSHRYPYPPELSTPLSNPSNNYNSHYNDRYPSLNNRHVIQKIPSHRDIHPHHLDPHSGIPADKRVLSILRNSLEIKQTGFVEPPKQVRHIPDVIVLDDVDDSVIEITDLTNDSESVQNKRLPRIPHNVIGHHIQMPKAVDSIPRETEYPRISKSHSKNKSPENDVASRIRTKAELKVLPPSHDNSLQNNERLHINLETERVRVVPKSQKQHLFNQIREDLRLESVIKSEKPVEIIIPEVKSEPMNIDEIEKDAVASIPPNPLEPGTVERLTGGDDLDWASACDNFMEQLKSGCHKKKNEIRKIRVEIIECDKEKNALIIPKSEPVDDALVDKVIVKASELTKLPTLTNVSEIPIIESAFIKQEPIDDYEIKGSFEPTPKINNHESISFEVSSVEEPIKEGKKESRQPSANKGLKDQKTPKKDRIRHKKSKIENQTRKEIGEPKAKRSLLMQNGTSKLQLKTKRFHSEKTDIKDKITLKSRDLQMPEHAKTRKPSQLETEKKMEHEKILNADEKASKEKIKSKLRRKNKNRNHKINVKGKVNIKIVKPKEISPDKKQTKEKEPIKTVIKEELESTDDDEPLIKSKIMKEKEMKYQLLKDLSEKSAYVKLECFDVDMNKNTRISIDSLTKEKDDKPNVSKINRQSSRSKAKSLLLENIKKEPQNEESSSNSDDENLFIAIASRLRHRKNTKTEDNKDATHSKSPGKSYSKKNDSASASSTPVRKPGFGDGSDFHPGWEDELYKFKRSLRMPSRLIAIPRGRSSGPFVRGTGAFFTRGSTSLPDLDPAPLSPAPSSAPSAATDDLYARRPEKLALDSDLESNSSCSILNRLQYDSEASTSTILSSSTKKKSTSIVDVLMQKCGKKNRDRKKNKEKDENKSPKTIPKCTNLNELLPTPSLGLLKNTDKGSLSATKEKLMEDIFYLGAFRKETVSAFRNAFIKNTDGLIGATEEFAPVVLKSRTRTESRVLKQRATIKEVFGDERPASAPPTSCREQEEDEERPIEPDDVPIINIKKESENKPKLKSKRIGKDKLIRRSSSIRDGLRSCALRRNDAKGRLMRLKKRNSLMKSLNSKRMKDITANKVKREKHDTAEDKKKTKEDGSSIQPTEGNTKRRLKRLFGRRKFSSGFDYIRKKKKVIRKTEDTTPNIRIRRPAVRPSPECENDIQKEIKGWFINKSVGETHLHRAARLGYTDCVAYCLEKMDSDPSAKDNAGFTPLHVAAAKGHVRIARLLLQYGANVSAAAQGGIRPLHEASENCHVEILRLLLAYGADPLLGTYSGQTPEELTEGATARFLKLHIADVQGHAMEPWRFPPPTDIIDHEELGCDPLGSPPPSTPPPMPESTIEIQCTDAPLPPFYSLRTVAGQPPDGLWCLLQDVSNFLQIKSKDSLLKQIHCGSGSPKELYREIRTQEFLERAQCHQLLCAGEKVNIRASKVALIRVTDKLRQLLKIETVLVS